MTCESPFRQPLAGLHVHFFLKTHQLCRHGDHGAFVASSEWLDVSYDALMRKLLFNGLGAETLHVVAPAAMPFADTATTGAITLAAWLRGNVGVAAGRADKCLPCRTPNASMAASASSVPERRHNRNGGNMSNESERDTMRPEYDFSSGTRGKHHEAWREGTNVVLLDPDVAEVFKDSETVNSALRTLARIAQAHVRAGR